MVGFFILAVYLVLVYIVIEIFMPKDEDADEQD